MKIVAWLGPPGFTSGWPTSTGASTTWVGLVFGHRGWADVFRGHHLFHQVGSILPLSEPSTMKLPRPAKPTTACEKWHIAPLVGST